MKWERICLIISLALAILITGTLVHERGLLVEARVQNAQKELAEEVLRFHVIANSDSKEDQKLKMQVKEQVLLYMKEHLPADAELTQTRNWVQTHLKDMEMVAKSVLEKYNSEHEVSVTVEQVLFPKKTYGDITFPTGEYEALRIKIGEAKGQNWWCCLYPNLCFIDAVHAVVPESGKEELQTVLEEDSYEMITAKADYKIKWFFFSR